MLASEEALNQLEGRLKKAAGILDSLKAENGTLKKEIEELKKDLEETRRESRAKDHTIRQYRDDRAKIRTRAEKILQKVSELEGQPVI